MFVFFLEIILILVRTNEHVHLKKKKKSNIVYFYESTYVRKRSLENKFTLI